MLAGIVGKPNVGKTTFFVAATLAPAEIAPYPFTTIKPNHGVAYLRVKCVCRELGVEDEPVNSRCIDGNRFIPVELIDCAGLVPDAWRGRGLGNQFLDEIRKADALIHVVDASGGTDLEGRAVKLGSHDPVKDVRFLERELTMWMYQIIYKVWPRLSRTAESGRARLTALIEERLSGLSIRKHHITEALRKAGLDRDKPTGWSKEDLIRFIDEIRKASKPMLLAANKIDLPKAEENVARLKELGYKTIPCCAEAELALRRATEKELINYKAGDDDFEILKPEALTDGQRRALETIRERILHKFGSTGVQEAINKAFFELLNMVTVYPIEDLEHLSDHKGNVLPDVYLVPKGTTARELAYKIHTELGESFVYAYEARSKRRIGEDYELKDRDVISIISAKKRA